MQTDTSTRKGQPIPSLKLQNAVAALLRWHSVDVDADRLIEGLPVVDGTLSEDLISRAVDRVGYKVAWTHEKAVRNLIYPCCIALASGDYAIAFDQDGKAVQVLDAQQTGAYRNVPLEELQKDYALRAFQCLPGTDLLLEKHASGNEKKHWFWGRLLLQKRSLFEVILASFFANVLAVVTGLFALQVYDRVIPGQAEATLWVLASGVGLAILFEAILRISRARLIDQVGKEAEIEITSDLFARTIGMKLDKRPASPGNIVHMVREFSSVKEFFTTAAVGVVADLPFAFVFLLLIYGIAGPVVWIIAVGAVLIVLPNILFQSRMARLSKETMGGMSSASRLLTEASYGLEAVKSTRSESMFQKQWEEIIALNAFKTTEQRSLSAFLTYWSTSLQQTTYVFALIGCVYLVFAGEVSVGAIIAIGILTTRTLSPITQLSQVLSRWQNMKTALGALEAVMSSEQDRSPERSYIRRPRLHGNLKFHKLRFVHPGTKTAALDIGNLNVEAGMRLALLGSNGSGKSTLLRLAAGLYDPTEGELLVDDLDMRQIDPSDLRRNIGYLPQETQMFRGTLRDNLTSGTQKRTDEELLEALVFSGLGEFVKHHPEGLDLQISDGGQGLSSGQKQSIGLARLYLQDPSIILLDEPTSTLDPTLESTIVPRIGKWIGSRSCIVATHRPQILSIMTHIVVLQQGQVILQGDRDATLKKLMPSPQSPKIGERL
jgi:ATP-binding cassette, subfamily C, bacterial LapB